MYLSIEIRRNNKTLILVQNHLIALQRGNTLVHLMVKSEDGIEVAKRRQKEST